MHARMVCNRCSTASPYRRRLIFRAKRSRGSDYSVHRLEFSWRRALVDARAANLVVLMNVTLNQ